MDSREQWINETIESLDGLRRAECDTRIFEKIEQRLTSPEHAARFGMPPAVLLRFAAGIALLITINVLSLVFYHTGSDPKVQTGFSTLAGEYFSYLNTINY